MEFFDVEDRADHRNGSHARLLDGQSCRRRRFLRDYRKFGRASPSRHSSRSGRWASSSCCASRRSSTTRSRPARLTCRRRSKRSSSDARVPAGPPHRRGPSRCPHVRLRAPARLARDWRSEGPSRSFRRRVGHHQRDVSRPGLRRRRLGRRAPPSCGPAASRGRGLRRRGARREILREMLARLHRSHFVLLSASAAADQTMTGDAIVPIEIRVAPAGGRDHGAVTARVHRRSRRHPGRGALGPRRRRADGRVLESRRGKAPTKRAKELRRVAPGVSRRAARRGGIDGDAAPRHARIAARPPLTSRARGGSRRGRAVRQPPAAPRRGKTSARPRRPAHHRAGVNRLRLLDDVDQRPRSMPEWIGFRDADGLIFDLRGNPRRPGADDARYRRTRARDPKRFSAACRRARRAIIR